MKTLRLILGDQLNYKHSWYGSKSDEVYYVLMEMRQETDYTKHHVQKIIGFFAAMYNFAQFLKKQGHNVIHLKINDEENTQILTQNLDWIIGKYAIQRFEYQQPDEYRLDKQLKIYCQGLTFATQFFDTEHFYTTRTELAAFFEGKKTFIMESFYRNMRKKHDVMMIGAEPEGDKWNFDAANRKPFKGNTNQIPTLAFEHDYRDILAEIDKSGIVYFGENMAEAFVWPTTRKESIQALDFFLKYLFANFGNYEDAMNSQHWALFHSRLSFAMNVKMISPKEVVGAAVGYWRANPTKISIEQCEGFVRQVLGWREYMRGIYWAKMPEFATLNYLNHERKLPAWFWTGQTKMQCLSHAIGQSLKYAYAHHIQRLMITGNFALLAGVSPDELDEWYLGIYIDAIEWVEITNTRGMSQFADGGIVGTKPYVSSANYIDKMSNYCGSCSYDKKLKAGPTACPFNSLYWHFYERNRNLLEKSPRIGMSYQLLNKMAIDDKAVIMAQAEQYLAQIETL